MIIYRPQRGSLALSMSEAKEFATEEEMKQYIVDSWSGLIKVNDIVISDEKKDDNRINWDGVYYVCTNQLGEDNYIEKYGCPQCIGMCSYGYIEANNLSTNKI